MNEAKPDDGATPVLVVLKIADPCYVKSLNVDGELTDREVNHCWAWLWKPGMPGQLGAWTNKKYCTTCLTERVVDSEGLYDSSRNHDTTTTA